MILKSTLLKKSILHIALSATFIVGLLGLNSCKKEEVDNTPYSAIALINASPTVATYDVYVGGTRVNNVALPAGGGVSYTKQVVGSYDVKFTVAGRTESIFTKNISLPQNVYQTYFLLGKPSAFEGLLVSDPEMEISTTNAYVRFINVSPDAPALDLAIVGGATLATNKAYKASSNFVPVAKGAYTFNILQNGTTTVKAVSESVNLLGNGYYTVMAKGLVAPAAGGTELPLSASVVITR
jgi:hypothetical protein